MKLANIDEQTETGAIRPSLSKQDSIEEDEIKDMYYASKPISRRKSSTYLFKDNLKLTISINKKNKKKKKKWDELGTEEIKFPINSTIKDLKENIELETGYKIKTVKYLKKQLADESTLIETGIENDHLLHVLIKKNKNKDLDQEKEVDYEEKEEEVNHKIFQDKHIVTNPLILLIGISNYNPDKGINDLPGVKKDLRLLINLFQNIFEYDIKCTFSKNKINSFDKIPLKGEDLMEFLYNQQEHIIKNKKKYDSLIVIFAGHGSGNKGGNDTFLTSDPSALYISKVKDIFLETTNNEYQKYFSNKPKIFIKLACRSGHTNIISQDSDSKNVKKPKNYISNDAEVYTIWSNTSNKSIKDKMQFRKGGFLAKSLYNTFKDDSEYSGRYKSLQNIIMSLTDYIKKKSDNQEIIENTNTCTKPIYFKRKSDDINLFEFFVDGLYKQVSSLKEEALKGPIPYYEYYVPLNAIDYEYPAKSKNLNLLVKDFLTDTQKSIAIIKGVSGSGKSMFFKIFFKSIWKHYETGNSIPLFIDLKEYAKYLKIGLLIDKYLADKGFDQKQRQTLKNKHDLLLFLDGFDETNLKIPIYNKNDLGKWSKKVIFSVRSEYNAETACFAVKENDEYQVQKCKEYEIQSFDNEQIKKYLKKYESCNKSSKNEDYISEPSDIKESGTYETKLWNSEDLKSLAPNPYMLYMIAEILPYLEDTNTHFRKIDIYQKFIDKYIDRNRNHDYNIQKSLYNRFGESLAAEMTKRNLDIIEYDSQNTSKNYIWRQYFGNDNQDSNIQKLRNGIPVEKINSKKDNISDDRNIQSNFEQNVDLDIQGEEKIDKIEDKEKFEKWSFNQKSILEYFCAKHLYKNFMNSNFDKNEDTIKYLDDDKAKSYTKILEDLPKMFEYFQRVSNNVDEKNKLSFLFDKPWFPKEKKPIKWKDILKTDLDEFKISNFSLNTKLLNHQPIIIKFLADYVYKDHNFKDKLHNCILGSRTNIDTSKAGANAMMVLNTANVSFSNKNFSDISVCWKNPLGVWEGPNLSGGIFYKTNFTRAKLNGANFSNCCLDKANFTDASLIHTNLGLAEFSIQSEMNSVFNCCRFLSENKIIVSESGYLKILDFTSQKLLSLKKVNAHCKKISSLDFTNNKKYLATGSYDNSIKLWKMHLPFLKNNKIEKMLNDSGTTKSSFTKKKTFQHDDIVTVVKFTKNGRFLLSGSRDKKIKFWSIDTSELIREYALNSAVQDLDIEEDYFVSASNRLHKWNLESKEKIFETSAKGINKYHCVRINKLNKKLFAGADDNSIIIFEGQNPIKRLWGHTGIVKSIIFNKSFSLMATASEDETIKLWKSNKLIRTLDGHKYKLYNIDMNQNNYIVSTSADKTLKIWKLHTNASYLRSFQGHKKKINSITISPSNSLVASSGDDYVIKMWDIKSGNLLYNLKQHNKEVNSICFGNETGTNIVASGDNEGVIKIWDTKTKQKKFDLINHEKAITTLCFCDKDKLLVSGSLDSNLNIWDIIKGIVLKTLKNDQPIKHISYNYDRTLAALGADGIISLYSITKKNLIKLKKLNNRLENNLNSNTSLCFTKLEDDDEDEDTDNTDDEEESKEGTEEKEYEENSNDEEEYEEELEENCLVVPQTDSTIDFISLSEELPSKLKGHLDEITILAYCNKTKTLASGSKDRSIKLWNMKNNIGKEIATLKNNRTQISNLKFTQDGKYLISSGGKDQTIQCWDIDNKIILWSSSLDPRTSFNDTIVQRIKGIQKKNLLDRGALLFSKDQEVEIEERLKPLKYIRNNIKEFAELQYEDESTFKFYNKQDSIYISLRAKKHLKAEKFDLLNYILKSFLKIREKENSFKYLDEADEEKVNDEKQFLLITAPSGSGKTVFSQKLEMEIWKKNKSIYDWIPIYLNLQSYNMYCSLLLPYIFKKMKIGNTSYPLMRNNLKILFILDAYDELSSRLLTNRNFREQIQVHPQWGKSKIILLSRNYAALGPLSSTQPYYERFVNKVHSKIFEHLEILPFEDDQILAYIQKFLKNDMKITISDYLEAWQKDLVHKKLCYLPSILRNKNISIKELIEHHFLMEYNKGKIKKINRKFKNIGKKKAFEFYYKYAKLLCTKMIADKTPYFSIREPIKLHKRLKDTYKPPKKAENHVSIYTDVFEYGKYKTDIQKQLSKKKIESFFRSLPSIPVDEYIYMFSTPNIRNFFASL